MAEETELGSSQQHRAGGEETRGTSCNTFRLGTRSSFFLHVPMESEAVEQGSLGVCAISVPGGFQALPGPSLEQPGPTPELPCFGQGLGLETSQGASSLEAPKILLMFSGFYNIFVVANI